MYLAVRKIYVINMKSNNNFKELDPERRNKNKSHINALLIYTLFLPISNAVFHYIGTKF